MKLIIGFFLCHNLRRLKNYLHSFFGALGFHYFGIQYIGILRLQNPMGLSISHL